MWISAQAYSALERLSGHHRITKREMIELLVVTALITVRVSQINGCRFCIDINSAVLAKRTGSMNKVEALERWQESELFDNKEMVVLEYVEAVTYTDRQVDDDLSQRLHEYFNEDEIVELTGLIAFQNLSSKFNSSLDLPAQGFCRLPESIDRNNENPNV